MAEEERYRVLSIPAGHVYTRAIKPDNVTFEPDPDINGAWWPHPALEAQWWDGGAEVDVSHIHFGFEHQNPTKIDRLIRAIHKSGVALVVTVHDIDNPHLADPADQAEHHERIRLLVRGANAVITLTDHARTRIQELVGAPVDVTVIPHPLVVTREEKEAVNAVPTRPGVFLKSLRSNVVKDPAFYVALAQVGTAIYIHDEPATQDFRDALAARGVDVIAHAPMDDDTLYNAVGGCTAVVLPYLRGTHSGWLEMCRDLGVGVAVPDIGCYADQADSPDAIATYPAGDGAAAAQAVRTLADDAPHPYVGDREEQLERIRAAHAAIYKEVVSA
ncbi:Uncharacterised protein [Corynebacterium pilosum]|uniref:Uncharacterized protein n=1 Tax=Corynebacterium pilosum TaxID=35756 RepID=A0A376CJM2_9CORY|nr:Uncharacterised protein [Corynebacterium pilosum]